MEDDREMDEGVVIGSRGFASLRARAESAASGCDVSSF